MILIRDTRNIQTVVFEVYEEWEGAVEAMVRFAGRDGNPVTQGSTSPLNFQAVRPTKTS